MSFTGGMERRHKSDCEFAIVSPEDRTPKNALPSRSTSLKVQ
ncbi:hypothetical protein BN903_18 [Halorubrum sp. AJ67]|nr:hypothetical protein BN903_18 [Halorubrum sp. AJ67]